MREIYLLEEFKYTQDNESYFFPYLKLYLRVNQQ